jgi:hypothetical protein
MVEEDEFTITALQNEATEARKNALVANKQSVEATEMISLLNIEINSLKRKIRAIESEKIKRTGDGSYQAIATIADQEVDTMLRNNESFTSLSSSPTHVKTATATPFQRWKIEQFLYAPDATTTGPSASLTSSFVNSNQVYINSNNNNNNNVSVISPWIEISSRVNDSSGRLFFVVFFILFKLSLIITYFYLLFVELFIIIYYYHLLLTIIIIIYY